MAKSNKGKPKLKNLTDEEILELSKRLLPNIRRGLYANESQGSGDYQAVGDGTGALGFYQFVPSHHWSDIKAHAKANGYGDNISQADFLNNPELQESYFEKVWLPYLVKESLKTFNLYGEDKGLTFEETIALSHFRGVGGARTMLRENRLDVREESNNKTGREFLNTYNEAVPKDIQITPEIKKDPKERVRLINHFKDERKKILNSNDSDHLKAIKLDNLQREIWDSGYVDDVNEWIDAANDTSNLNVNESKDRIHSGFELINMINSRENDGKLVNSDLHIWGDPDKPHDFGGVYTLYGKENVEKFRHLIDNPLWSKAFEKHNSGYVAGVDPRTGKKALKINKAKLLNIIQNEANKMLPPDQKLELVEIKNGKIYKGKDFSVSESIGGFEGFVGGIVADLDNVFQGKKPEGQYLQTLNIKTDWLNSLDPQIPLNTRIIEKIEPQAHWLTQKEEKQIVEDTKEAITDEDRDNSIEHFNPYEPTEAQKQIANQEPVETGHELSDAFFDTSMFSGVEDNARPADISDYKQPDIPYAEIGSSLFGIIMGSDAANTELPERDEVVSDALLRYTNELKRISQQGLSPEEEAYAKNNLRDSYAVGLDTIVRASGGNRNVVLGNASRLDAQMQRGLMDLSLADFQKREKALYQYGEAVKYINEVDLNKQIANNERAYQNAVATKEAGAQLMSSGIQSLLDNIQYYKENAPGSAQHALKSYYNRKVYNYDPNIKDNGKGDIMYSQSWYNNQRNNFKALRESQMDMGNKYASLSVDQKREVNNLLRDSNSNQEIVWNFVNELYDYNQSPEAMVDEAQFSSQPNSQPTVPENGSISNSYNPSTGETTYYPYDFGANHDGTIRSSRDVPAERFNYTDSPYYDPNYDLYGNPLKKGGSGLGIINLTQEQINQQSDREPTFDQLYNSSALLNGKKLDEVNYRNWRYDFVKDFNGNTQKIERPVDSVISDIIKTSGGDRNMKSILDRISNMGYNVNDPEILNEVKEQMSSWYAGYSVPQNHPNNIVKNISNPYGYGNRNIQSNYHKSNPTPNVFNIPGFNSAQSYKEARQNKALNNMTNNFVLDNFGGYSQEDLDNLILESQSNRN